MFDETANDLADLTAEYHEHHSPSNPEEHLLVETLIPNEWRLRRIRRVETKLWRDANYACQVHKIGERSRRTRPLHIRRSLPYRFPQLRASPTRGQFLRVHLPPRLKTWWRGPTACELSLCPRNPPRNPNIPRPLPRIWFRSVKIRKPAAAAAAHPMPAIPSVGASHVPPASQQFPTKA
jgi:hypothetical protein